MGTKGVEHNDAGQKPFRTQSRAEHTGETSPDEATRLVDLNIEENEKKERTGRER